MRTLRHIARSFPLLARPRRGTMAGTALALCALAPAAAEAASTCPGESEVRARVASALGADDARRLGSLPFELHDSGEALSLVQGAWSATFDDPSRRCEARADWAAVQLALRLRPPFPASRRPLALRSTSVETAHPPEALRPVRLELGGQTTIAAAGTDPRGTSGGVDIGGSLAVRRRVPSFELSGGAAFQTATRLELEGWGIRLWRLPVRLGGRLLVGSERTRLGVGAGLELALLRLHGLEREGLEPSRRSFRGEVGGRLEVLLRQELSSRWGVQLVASAVAVPRPHRLGVEPLGEVGRTPTRWWGLGAGLTHHWSD